jgi:transposase
VEIDNDAAERALRTVVLGRKNYLFAGSKLNDLDSALYLRDIPGCIADQPINPVDELLPWN